MIDAVGAIVRANLDAATSVKRAQRAVVAVSSSDGSLAEGFKRADSEVGIDPEQRFLLYSFSKVIVAAAVLRIVAGGKLNLDDTLEKWLPERAVANRVTLRHLLQHTGGLPDYGRLSEYHDAVRAGGPPWTEDEFISRTRADELCFEPGEGWAYSNIGYMLVRLVLERATGDDFGTVLRREVFDPFGLASAAVSSRQEDLSSFTFGPSHYLGGDGAPVSVPERYHPGWIAPGVVGATAADAALMLHSFFTIEKLRTEAVRSTSVGRRPFIGSRYGLGLMVEMTEDFNQAYGHLGSGPGSSAAVFHFSHDVVPLTIAVLTDGEDVSQAEDIAVAVAMGLRGGGKALRR